MVATLPIHITATGNVGSANGGELRSAVLVGGSDAATLTIRQNGSGGETLLSLKAPANETRSHLFQGGAVYSGQLHATLAGTGPVATVEL